MISYYPFSKFICTYNGLFDRYSKSLISYVLLKEIRVVYCFLTLNMMLVGL